MTTALEVDEWSAARPGRPLPPGKTWFTLYRRLSGPQGRSGRVQNLDSLQFDPWTVQPVAQSLYRLIYPAHKYISYTFFKISTNSKSRHRPHTVWLTCTNIQSTTVYSVDNSLLVMSIVLGLLDTPSYLSSYSKLVHLWILFMWYQKMTVSCMFDLGMKELRTYCRGVE